VTQKSKPFVEMSKNHFEIPNYINQVFTVLHDITTEGVQPNVPRSLKLYEKLLICAAFIIY